MELADTRDLKSRGRKSVRVQIPSLPPYIYMFNIVHCIRRTTMGLFDLGNQILKTADRITILPVSIVRDTVTLGGVITNE